MAEFTWQTPKYYKRQNIYLFINTLINTNIYTVNMAEPTTIKCSKCHIYKPYINFVKDGPLKKLLKLCQLY